MLKSTALRTKKEEQWVSNTFIHMSNPVYIHMTFIYRFHNRPSCQCQTGLTVFSEEQSYWPLTSFSELICYQWDFKDHWQHMTLLLYMPPHHMSLCHWETHFQCKMTPRLPAVAQFCDFSLALIKLYIALWIRSAYRM